jgi:hypothetical protein
VLLGAIGAGSELLTWEHDSFAFAENYDKGTGRYRGLRGGQLVSLADADVPGLLVKPDVARAQLDAERAGLRPADGPSAATRAYDGGRSGRACP